MIPAKLRLLQWFKGKLPPGKSSPLEIVMIQSTATCNIDCDYCYLPNRTSKNRFDPALLEPLFGKLSDAGLLGESLSIVWHAGEPLVLPPAWYDDAIGRIHELAGNKSRITHFFQTNGMLLTQDYCDLIRRHDIRVGLSIDGPAEIHDRHRRTRAGEGTHAKAMQGVDLLRRNNIRFSVIAVVTEDSLDHADEIYAFFRGIGVSDLGLNVDEIESANSESSLLTATTEERYRAFMTRMLERMMEDRGAMHIRDIAQALRAVNGDIMGADSGSSENNPFSILSVDTKGDLFTFSPELLDMAHPRAAELVIGNVADVDFRKIYQTPRFAALNDEVQRGVAACREDCGYFALCGGGAPANKLTETGRFDSTETLFCRFTKQITAEIVRDYMIARLNRPHHRPPARG